MDGNVDEERRNNFLFQNPTPKKQPSCHHPGRLHHPKHRLRKKSTTGPNDRIGSSSRCIKLFLTATKIKKNLRVYASKNARCFGAQGESSKKFHRNFFCCLPPFSTSKKTARTSLVPQGRHHTSLTSPESSSESRGTTYRKHESECHHRKKIADSSCIEGSDEMNRVQQIIVDRICWSHAEIERRSRHPAMGDRGASSDGRQDSLGHINCFPPLFARHFGRFTAFDRPMKIEQFAFDCIDRIALPMGRRKPSLEKLILQPSSLLTRQAIDMEGPTGHLRTCLG